jgi:hypothetical protein
MKSAYELAMERLSQQSPTVKLTAEQKRQMAELDSRYAARVAEREIGLRAEMVKAIQTGDLEQAEQLQQQLAVEKRKLQAELEEKKERIRNPA